MLFRTMLATAAMLLLSVTLPACDTVTAGETTEEAEAAVNDAVVDAAADTVEIPKAIGAGLAASVTTTHIADILAKPDDYLGKTVRITGMAVHRCGSGCSLTVSEGDDELKVRANKEEFEFPASWKDQAVVVEGTFQLDPGCAAMHAKDEAKAAEETGDADPHKGEHQAHAEALGDEGEVTYTIQVSGATLAG